MTTPITVLLVDDHPVVRAGLRAVLDREGVEVVAEASSGSEAVDVARRLAPHVILMDFAMPGIDSVTATRRIRLLRPEARILLLVSRETDEEMARGLRAGAIGCIAKDASPETIVEAVCRAARS